MATPGRETAHRQSAGWLAGRFDLFERYCLPSIAAQDSRDFQWLIFFDIHTPDWARERIEAGQKSFPFTPVFTELFEAEGWARNVRAAIGPAQADRIVITSNLDNDDGLANNYMRSVRETAAANWNGSTFAVNVPDGYVLAGSNLYAHRHLYNAFTNLVEADDDSLATTKTIRHMDLPDRVMIVQAESGPGWLQLVHDGNVSNKIRGYRVQRPEGGRFADGLLAGVGDASSARLFWDNQVEARIRKGRDDAFRLIRRLIPADRHVG